MYWSNDSSAWRSQGLTGVAGPQGPQGLTGAVGPEGPQGSVGPTGPTGSQGEQGLTGPAGPEGPAGPTGPAGNDGSQGLTGAVGPEGPAGPQGDAGAGLSAEDVEILGHMSIVDDGCKRIVVSGVNLQLVNGMDDTETKNCLGNLIVGYNEDQVDGEYSPIDAANDRTGSHNLIVGMEHTYSSYGGLVAGYANTISGNYSSVSGGGANTASGEFSSVSGGQNVTVSEDEGFGWSAGTSGENISAEDVTDRKFRQTAIPVSVTSEARSRGFWARQRT